MPGRQLRIGCAIVRGIWHMCPSARGGVCWAFQEPRVEYISRNHALRPAISPVSSDRLDQREAARRGRGGKPTQLRNDARGTAVRGARCVLLSTLRIGDTLCRGEAGAAPQRMRKRQMCARSCAYFAGRRAAMAATASTASDRATDTREGQAFPWRRGSVAAGFARGCGAGSVHSCLCERRDGGGSCARSTY